MIHNIRIYDTGKTSAYRRRNDGWLFASCFAGAIAAAAALFMIMIGFFDPAVPFGVAIAGFILLGLDVTNMGLFITHRNFGLSESGTKVMDAVYTLPKEVRKEYQITREEAESIDHHEANRLVNAVSEYRRSNITNPKGVVALTQQIADHNKMVREIEGR